MEDNIAPVATCQDVTVQLDASGNGSTTATAVTMVQMMPVELQA
ncbi:MAG: hypothetical protein R2728_03040 [Chitinophagales bacterium]